MALEIGAKTNAEHGGNSVERMAQRNGYRARLANPRGPSGPKFPAAADGVVFSVFLGTAPLGRKGADSGDPKQAYIHGISTRSMDDLVQAMGGSGISKSHVGRPCEESDERVDACL